MAEVSVLRPMDSQEWDRAIREVNIIAGPPRVDESFLRRANNLEMLQTFGIGYDQIDVRACTSKRVIVCNVAEVYSEPVAQHAWAMILDLSKNVTKADRAMRAGTWQSYDWRGFQLQGRILGVVGLGGIGSRVVMKGRLAFNMKTLACDPYVLPERAQLFGAELVDYERLFKESDVIVISVPLTNETRHLVSRKLLSLMKKTAILINVCRGPVLDQDALVEYLKKGEIAGAGLDVFETEPLPIGSALLGMENVVLTPHIASSTKEAIEKTYREGVVNILDYLKGRKPHYIVNPEAYGD